MKNYVVISVILIVALSQINCEQKSSDNKSRPTSELLVRNVIDTVGFSQTPHQIEEIVRTAESIEREHLNTINSRFISDDESPWIAAICPHDDHVLAARVYVSVFQNMVLESDSPVFVVFGVAHKAWRWDAENVLIFDSFDFWKAPYGNMEVSSLRDELIALLPSDNFVINNEWQQEEHSVEGIVPFIQYYNRNAHIISILVPYMNWDRLEILSQNLAGAMQTVMLKHKLKPGKDIAFIFSNDGSHYGDEDWGGKNYAPYGTDQQGYQTAIKNDVNLLVQTLTGKVTSTKLKSFCDRVWGDDLRTYKMTWCGRFAIPLGLNTVKLVVNEQLNRSMRGHFLRYDTSYKLGRLPVAQDIGIGTTMPYNIHHWVGYSAVGYR